MSLGRRVGHSCYLVEWYEKTAGLLHYIESRNTIEAIFNRYHCLYKLYYIIQEDYFNSLISKAHGYASVTGQYGFVTQIP